MNVIADGLRKLTSFLSRIDWLPPLLLRLAAGYVFFNTGKGKLEHLDNVSRFFADLRIPFPAANAALVAGLECFGGLFLMLGLLTRAISIPLMAIMAVAIATAKWSEVQTLHDFAGMSELYYLLIFFWLATRGAGCVSCDHWIDKKFGGREP